MWQIITKHKDRYKVFQALPMCNVHPYFSLQNLGKSAHYTQQNTVVLAAVVSSVEVRSYGMQWAVGPRWLVSIQEGLERHAGRVPRDDRGRYQSDTAGFQGMTKIEGHHQKLGRGKEGFPESQREQGPAATSILNSLASKTVIEKIAVF